MRKFFAVTLAAILVASMAMPAMATNSRLRAMGDVDRYIEDDANIFMWPATLPSYANLLIMDINYHGPAMYGMTYALGEYGDYGALGLFFMEDTEGPNIIDWEGESPMGWAKNDIFSQNLYNKWNLMYAYEMEKMSLGIRFVRASNMELTDTTDPGMKGDFSESYTTIGASWRMEFNEEVYFDLGFDYTMASYSDEYNASYDGVPLDSKVSDDKGSVINAMARIFFDYSEDLTIVPYIGVGMAEFNLTSNDENFWMYWDGMGYSMASAHGLKWMNFDLGLAFDWNVNEDNMIVLGIEPFSYVKVEPSEYHEDFDGEYLGSMTTMPRFLLALETDVRDWLTFRTGCTKALTKMKFEYSDGTTEYNYEEDEAPFEWFLGLGFHVGDFDIDCVLQRDVPFKMGYWLTGYQTNDYMYRDNGYGYGAPIGRISALYHF